MCSPISILFKPQTTFKGFVFNNIIPGPGAETYPISEYWNTCRRQEAYNILPTLHYAYAICPGSLLPGRYYAVFVFRILVFLLLCRILRFIWKLYDLRAFQTEREGWDFPLRWSIYYTKIFQNPFSHVLIINDMQVHVQPTINHHSLPFQVFMLLDIMTQVGSHKKFKGENVGAWNYLSTRH